MTAIEVACRWSIVHAWYTHAWWTCPPEAILRYANALGIPVKEPCV